MTYKNIIFDMDDTLLVCGKHYIEVREAFQKYQHERTGVDPKIIDKLFNDFDITCTQLPNGFGKERYPRSFAAISIALDVVMGNEINELAADHSYVIGHSVFEAEYPLFEGVEEMLEQYQSSGIGLFLCTKGDFSVQQRKIDKHNLGRFFQTDRTYIILKKTGDVVKRIMKDHNLDATSTVFVGDSLKDDVGSAHAAGIDAIHIADPSKPVWAYDNGTNIPEWKLGKVTELPQVIPFTAPATR